MATSLAVALAVVVGPTIGSAKTPDESARVGAFPDVALAQASVVPPSDAPATHDHSTHDHQVGVVNPTAVPEPSPDPDNGLVFRRLQAADEGPCDGLYEVTRVPGTTCSHGPDVPFPGLDPQQSVEPATASTPSEVVNAPAEEAAAAAVVAAATVPCDGDGISGNRVQALYVHGSTNRFTEFRDSFIQWTAGIDTIYSDSAKITGGDRHVRFVTENLDGTCQPTVIPVQVPDSALSSFGGSISAIKAAGYDRADRKYVMWTDSKVYCGIGGFAGDTRKSASNRSNFGPSYGRNDSGCWTSSVAAHELGHNLGAVNNNAPNTSGGAHCTDEYDVMCYRDSPNYPTMRIICGDRSYDRLLDCKNDDYYSTNPAPGSYLATNFNMADNIFLIQGDGGGGGGGGGTDSTDPSAPTGVTSADVTTSGLTLSWTAATDDVGVTGYAVYRDGTQIGTASTTTMSVSGLTAGTTYSFTVRATDAAGNASPDSAPLSVTTAAAPTGGLTVGTTGTLANSDSGLVADVPRGSRSSGTPVIAYPRHGAANQQWTVVAGTTAGTVQLRSEASGLCLSVRRASRAPGAYVAQRTCDGRPHKSWTATSTADGYVLAAQHSGLVLGVGAYTYDAHPVLSQLTGDGSAKQAWVFAPR